MPTNFQKSYNWKKSCSFLLDIKKLRHKSTIKNYFWVVIIVQLSKRMKMNLVRWRQCWQGKENTKPLKEILIKELTFFFACYLLLVVSFYSLLVTFQLLLSNFYSLLSNLYLLPLIFSWLCFFFRKLNYWSNKTLMFMF